MKLEVGSLWKIGEKAEKNNYGFIATEGSVFQLESESYRRLKFVFIRGKLKRRYYNPLILSITQFKEIFDPFVYKKVTLKELLK